MKMLERYLSLYYKVGQMVEAGTDPLDPVIRSIERQLYKIYLALTQEEQGVVYLAMYDPIPY